MAYNKVDFAEVKQTAAEINEVKKRMRKSMGIFGGWHIFLIIMPLVGLSLGAYYDSNYSNTSGADYVGFFAFLIITYILFLIRKTIYISIYRKKLPTNAPNSISELIWKLFITENRKIDRFEVMVYKDRVLTQKDSNLQNVKYENLGYIESQSNDEYDFYTKAYELKADVIINFSTNISHSTSVSESKGKVSSSTKEHRYSSGNAVKILGEDTVKESNSLTLTEELDKLARLKADGHLTEEEFSAAKKNIMEKL